MLTVADIEAFVEEIAPPKLAFPGDPIGHLVGERTAGVDAVGVALDATTRVIGEAQQRGCGLLVVHHPLIYEPLRRLDPNADPVARCVWLLARAGISLFAAHTNWDMAEGGVSDALAASLGLTQVRPFGQDVATHEAKIVTFVPAEYAEAVVDAMAAAGAGRIGRYERCAFMSEGRGTFDAPADSSPFVGAPGERASVAEVRLEMVAPTEAAANVTRALIAAHPYEEPAYDVYPLAQRQAGAGRVGAAAHAPSAEAFAATIQDRLGHPVRVYGDRRRLLRSVAVVGGAGSDWLGAAARAGADALVTGEVRHHHGLCAEFYNMVVFEAGHEGTEQPGMDAMAARLRERFGETLRVERL